MLKEQALRVGSDPTGTNPVRQDLSESRSKLCFERVRERPDRDKSCETGFERVSVKAVPEPRGVIGVLGGVPLGEGVAANEVGAQGETSPFKIVIISKLCYEKFFF